MLMYHFFIYKKKATMSHFQQYNDIIFTEAFAHE